MNNGIIPPATVPSIVVGRQPPQWVSHGRCPLCRGNDFRRREPPPTSPMPLQDARPKS